MTSHVSYYTFGDRFKMGLDKLVMTLQPSIGRAEVVMCRPTQHLAFKAAMYPAALSKTSILCESDH
jgi:hypothetical protein